MRERRLFLPLSLTYRLFESNGTSKADAGIWHENPHLPELLTVNSHIRGFWAFSSNAALVRHVGELRYFRARNSFNISSQRCILNPGSAMTEVDPPKFASCYALPWITLQNTNRKPSPAVNHCHLITPFLPISSTDPVDRESWEVRLAVAETQSLPSSRQGFHSTLLSRCQLWREQRSDSCSALCTRLCSSLHRQISHGPKGLLLLHSLVPQHGAWLVPAVRPSKVVDAF